VIAHIVRLGAALVIFAAATLVMTPQPASPAAPVTSSVAPVASAPASAHPAATPAPAYILVPVTEKAKADTASSDNVFTVISTFIWAGMWVVIAHYAKAIVLALAGSTRSNKL
jgi:hypothetical protein